MKLDDIDQLNNWRTQFNSRKYQLKAVQNRPQNVIFGGQTITDNDIMEAVRLTIRPMIQAKLEEAKTKLMMMGIDEFPE